MTDPIDVAEVARRTGASKTTVRHWLETGQLRGFARNRDPNPKKVRWSVEPEDLEAFIATRTNRPAPTAGRRRKAGPVTDWLATG